MATYEELRNLGKDSDLQNRAEVAIIIAAQTLADAGNLTNEQRRWIVRALTNPRDQAEIALRYLLARNRGLTPTAISEVSEGHLQTGVNAIVPILVAAASL